MGDEQTNCNQCVLDKLVHVEKQVENIKELVRDLMLSNEDVKQCKKQQDKTTIALGAVHEQLSSIQDELNRQKMNQEVLRNTQITQASKQVELLKGINDDQKSGRDYKKIKYLIVGVITLTGTFASCFDKIKAIIMYCIALFK